MDLLSSGEVETASIVEEFVAPLGALVVGLPPLALPLSSGFSPDGEVGKGESVGFFS